MLGDKYKEYYYKVENNQKNFEFILETIKNTSSFDEQLQLAMFALKYATYNNTGYFTSSFLETFFVKYANEIDIKNYNIGFKKNTFLHVLTEAYNTGGHTRVVERWIKYASSDQIHSVLVIKPNSENLFELENIIKNQNGEYIKLDNNLSLKEKALKLREIGLNYEYIVLHTHMEDPTATVAFGTEKFTRPVLLYNHASHMFWIGKSVADMVLDIQRQDDITIQKRNIQNPIYLGIPIKPIEFKEVDKIEVRKKLNLPLDKKIIVTSGNKNKYMPICKDNFGDIIENLLNKKTYCYLIGPKEKDLKNLHIKKNPNIKALGKKNFNQGYTDFLAAADLYLDSFPLCSATATMDAIASNTPVLSLKSVYTPLDYLGKSDAFCKTKEELASKANNILNSEKFAQENLEKLKKLLVADLSCEAWNKRINQLLEIIPKKHSVKNLENEIDNKKICDLAVYVNVICNKNFLEKNKIKLFNKDSLKNILLFGTLEKKQGIPFVFEVLKYKKQEEKIKIIKIFNIKIFEYKK